MTPTLLPCAHCGSENVSLREEGPPYYVTCLECDADSGWTDTPDEAIARWNRRAGEAQRPYKLTLLESDGWQTYTTDSDGRPCVAVHSRNIGGVLCRWWGDGPAPSGVEVIESIAREALKERT